MERQEIDVKPAIRSFIRFSRLHLVILWRLLAYQQAVGILFLCQYIPKVMRNPAFEAYRGLLLLLFLIFLYGYEDANLEDPPRVDNTEYRRVVNITQPVCEAPRDLEDPPRVEEDTNLKDPPRVDNTEYRRVVNITQPLNDSTWTIHTPEGNYSVSTIHNAEAPRDLFSNKAEDTKKKSEAKGVSLDANNGVPFCIVVELANDFESDIEDNASVAPNIRGDSPDAEKKTKIPEGNEVRVSRTKRKGSNTFKDDSKESPEKKRKPTVSENDSRNGLASVVVTDDMVCKCLLYTMTNNKR